MTIRPIEARAYSAPTPMPSNAKRMTSSTVSPQARSRLRARPGLSGVLGGGLLAQCEVADVLEVRRQRHDLAVLDGAEDHGAVEEPLERRVLRPLLGEVDHRDHALGVEVRGLVGL